MRAAEGIERGRARIRTALGLWIVALLPFGTASCGGSGPSLRSSDPYARYLALLERVEASPDEEAARLAVGMLQDRAWLVREGALIALAKLGRTDSGQSARPLLSDPHPMVRETACRTLAALGDRGAAADLVRTLANDQAMEVRRAAAEALGKLGEVGQAARALVGALGDSDPSVRLAAVESLQALSGESYGPEDRPAWERWAEALP